MKKDSKEETPTVSSVLGDIQDEVRETLDTAEKSLEDALGSIHAAKKRLKDIG